MRMNAQTTRATEQKRARTKQDNDERQNRVQSDGRSSVTRSIAQAVVLKDGDLFFLSEPDGSVPLDGEHGLGLYYHDCRFLNGYEFKLGTVKPSVLVSTAAAGFAAAIELTNPDLKASNHGLICKDQIAIRWDRILDNEKLALCDVFTLRNYCFESLELPFDFDFRSEFEPLFAVRGLLGQKLGKLRPPSWRGGVLRFDYDGADGIERSLSIHFSPTPQTDRNGAAHFQIRLESEEGSQQNCHFRSDYQIRFANKARFVMKIDILQPTAKSPAPQMCFQFKSTGKRPNSNYDRNQNSFGQYYEGTDLDASLLMIPLVGFLPQMIRA